MQDFDGDGHADLVWQSDTARQVTVQYYGGPQGITYLGYNWIYPSSAAGWRVAGVADFNADGHPDLVWQADDTREVTVQYYGGSNGVAYLGYNWVWTSPAQGWRVVAVADFNGDGHPDLVWQADGSRQITVQYYGGAQGASYINFDWLRVDGTPGWTVVGANDIDGDGNVDLILQNDATRQLRVDYYGGPPRPTLLGSAILNNGKPGWQAIVPR
jgi:hypothetical protein